MQVWDETYDTHIVEGFGPGVYATSSIIAFEENVAQNIYCHWQRVHCGTIKSYTVTKTLKLIKEKKKA